MSKYCHIFNAIHDKSLAKDPSTHGILPLVDQATGTRFGWIDRRNSKLRHALTEYGRSVFKFEDGQVAFCLQSDASPEIFPSERTRLLDIFATHAASYGAWPKPANDSIPVWPGMVNHSPLAHIDRNSIYPLGIMARGSHLICTYPNGDYLLTRRSQRVALYKGALDVTVGGLVSAGQTPVTALKAEALDEIGLNPAWVAAQIAGQRPRTYEYMRRISTFPPETNGGIWHDRVYAWTATLPEQFAPRLNDGEVARVVRVTPDELKSHLETPDAIKPNSALMLLDDLDRNGHFNRSQDLNKTREQLGRLYREADFSMDAS